MSRTVKQTRDFTLKGDVSLKRLNTFAVSASAQNACFLDKLPALPRVLESVGGKVLLLGQGSNILFTRDYEGLVIKLCTEGIRLLKIDNQGIHVRAYAGESWDRFVRWTISNHFPGLENLILIPGTVGAAPIQNIGAYGVEVSEFVEQIRAFDRESFDWVTLENSDCHFKYRNSVFKQKPNRYIIGSVDFVLPKKFRPRLEYPEVARMFRGPTRRDLTPESVALKVQEIRKRKLPNPQCLGNAGSFFKNPVLDKDRLSGLTKKLPDCRSYAVDSARVKVSAAALIEACGFKGYREGDVGVYEKHALVIVNHGGGTGREIWSLASRIRREVLKAFGIALEPEPLIL